MCGLPSPHVLHWSKFTALHFQVAFPSRAYTNSIRPKLRFNFLFLTVGIIHGVHGGSFAGIWCCLRGHAGCPGIKANGQVWAWGSGEPATLALSEAGTGSKPNLFNKLENRSPFFFSLFHFEGVGTLPGVSILTPVLLGPVPPEQ